MKIELYALCHLALELSLRLLIPIAAFLILKTKIDLINLSCNGKVIGIHSGA